MKKKLLILLAMVLLLTGTSSAFAKTEVSTELAECIKLYKAENYTECYAKLTDFVTLDTANALAYYYLAMTATQIGRQEEAIDNYSKAIMLAPQNSNLAAYARKGKRCLEEPEACEEAVYDTPLEEFVKQAKHVKLSDEVNSQIEQLKIQEMMRKMNRFEDIDKSTFDEYHDFSTMNNTATPSNDEIVAALRTLQKAGLSNYANMNNSGLSVLTGNQENNVLNMLGNSSISPQLIQTMLTNNMSLGL